MNKLRPHPPSEGPLHDLHTDGLELHLRNEQLHYTSARVHIYASHRLGQSNKHLTEALLHSLELSLRARALKLISIAA